MQGIKAMALIHKKYACERIRQIAKDAARTLAGGEQPSLTEHVQAAVLNGTAKMKSAACVIAPARRGVESGGVKYDIRLPLTSIFRPPASYVDAMKPYEAKQNATKNATTRLRVVVQELCDSVMLDRFPTAQVAIDKMQAIASTKMPVILSDDGK